MGETERRKQKHTNSQRKLDANEEQFHVETRLQDRMPPELPPQQRILPADENRTDDIARQEQPQEPIMQIRIVISVVHAQQDDAQRSSDSSQDGDDIQALLEPGGVGGEAAVVPEPALGDHGGVEEDDGDGGHGYEEGV